jgi:hypothetical protein
MKTKTEVKVKTYSMPSFQTTRKEAELIVDIVRRAEKMGLCGDRMSLNMDITACHANGNRLRFEDLLKADDFNFTHDICGIQRTINRSNGKLLDFFLPRYSEARQ